MTFHLWARIGSISNCPTLPNADGPLHQPLFGASLADALPMIRRRNPEVVSEVVRRLDNQ